ERTTSTPPTSSSPSTARAKQNGPSRAPCADPNAARSDYRTAAVARDRRSRATRGGPGFRRAADGRVLSHEATRVRGRAGARPSTGVITRRFACETVDRVRPVEGPASAGPRTDVAFRMRQHTCAAVRQFFEAMGRHPRLTATAIQTVGAKG